MTDEQTPPDVKEQQEIVHRFALELQQSACSAAVRPAEPSIRRCYELLNQCAMELAGLNRRAPGADSLGAN